MYSCTLDVLSGVWRVSNFQAYERGGYHAGTPPPSFSMALPSAGGNQAGALGAPAVYGPPYMPLVPHQQSHSQLLHHAIPQVSPNQINQSSQLSSNQINRSSQLSPNQINQSSQVSPNQINQSSQVSPNQINQSSQVSPN